MDRPFLSVLNMSLIGAFVIAAICLARLPLRKAPKIISYCLWAVAGFRLVFPFPIESVFSLMPIKPQPIPADIAMQAVPRIDSGIPFVNDAVSSVLPAPPADVIASVNPLQVWTIIGAYLWIAGVAAMLIYSVISIIRLKRGLRGSVYSRENIYESASLKTPLVIGMFRPRIYLPAGLSVDEYKYILLHELTHIRRRDHIVKMFAYFVLCLHWFNPLVWAAFLLMGADMEMSCDERVLKELGGDIKSDYSMSLVRIAAGRRILNGSPLAFGEGGMKERIKRVLNFKKPSRIIVITAVALAAVLSVGFAVSKSGKVPSELKALSADDIVSFTVMASPPGESKTVSNRLYISDLAATLRTVEIYNQDDSYKDYFGQWTEFNLTMKSGETLTVTAYNPFIIINRVGYKTKYGPCEALNSLANNLLATEYASNPVADLSTMRTPYVGNNSTVGKILGALPPLDDKHTQRFFSLGTSSEPYSLTAYYEPSGSGMSAEADVRNITNAPKNAALLFALIDNLGEVNFAFRDTPSGSELDESAYKSSITFSKDNITQYLLDNFGLSFESFHNDWNGSFEKLYATATAVDFKIRPEPDNYMLTMSSYPGIYLFTSGQAEGGAPSLRYECKSGHFGTLKDGVITFYGSMTERAFGDGPAVFWAPGQTTQDGDWVAITPVGVIGDNTSAVRFTVRISGITMNQYSLVQEPPVQITSGAQEWNGATRNITLDDIRAIAHKIGPDLTFGNLRDFTGTDIGSGLYIMAYYVEGGEYRLTVGSTSADMSAPVMYAYLRKSNDAVNINGSIDIRYYDVDKYLADGTRELARPLPSMEPSATALPQLADNLDDAIDIAIVSHNGGIYGGGGDFAAASHVTLKTVESGNLVTAYVMAYYAAYTSEDGIHETAGSHIPAAITLEKPSFGLVEYWEAKDGSYYLPSIHEKFPSDIWDKVDTQLYVKELQKNCLQKATAHYASLPPVTAENSLYQAYYQVARKLFEMDAGLNSNISLIGFDINSVPESQRGLLANRLLMWINGEATMKPYFSTYDELVTMGLIVTKPLDKAGFTNGVLIRFYESSFQNGVLTVKADKYRTPLGAVGAEFTVRFKNGKWTVDEPGMVWMS